MPPYWSRTEHSKRLESAEGELNSNQIQLQVYGLTGDF